MPSVELIGLIELLRQLIQRSSEMDIEYFNNFIQPTWLAFSTIHNDYKTSIRKYTELIVNPEFEVSELIKIIRQDSIVTEDIRAELEIMIDKMPMQYLERKGKTDLLAKYVHSIADYFITDNLIRNSISVEKNKQISDRLKKSLIKNFVDTVITIGNPQKSKKRGDILMVKIPNVARYSAIIYLSRGGENIDRESAAHFFENLFLFQQYGYKTALNDYYMLRTFLLQ